MRASDLLHADVLDQRGEHLGVVIGLRCVQDGPRLGSMNAPRVESLVVSRHRTGSLLGYDRPGHKGPWLVNKAVQWLHRGLLVIPWSDVTSTDPQKVTVRRAAGG